MASLLERFKPEGNIAVAAVAPGRALKHSQQWARESECAIQVPQCGAWRRGESEASSKRGKARLPRRALSGSFDSRTSRGERIPAASLDRSAPRSEGVASRDAVAVKSGAMPADAMLSCATHAPAPQFPQQRREEQHLDARALVRDLAQQHRGAQPSHDCAWKARK